MRFFFIIGVLLWSQCLLADDLILAKQVTIKSKFLAESRQVLVKLPDNYDQGNNTYPVLYLLHGQWDMLPALATLNMLQDQLPQFVVIGVEAKGKELQPNAENESPFAKFIAKEVTTYVKQHYRVAEFSILSGHSNAGRFVLDFWLNSPAKFSQYYAFSPSLEDNYIVERVAKLTQEQLNTLSPVVITMANEGEHMQDPFSQLIKQLSGFSILS